jgi:hypothetical protein
VDKCLEASIFGYYSVWQVCQKAVLPLFSSGAQAEDERRFYPQAGFSQGFGPGYAKPSYGVIHRVNFFNE